MTQYLVRYADGGYLQVYDEQHYVTYTKNNATLFLYPETAFRLAPYASTQRFDVFEAEKVVHIGKQVTN